MKKLLFFPILLIMLGCSGDDNNSLQPSNELVIIPIDKICLGTPKTCEFAFLVENKSTTKTLEYTLVLTFKNNDSHHDNTNKYISNETRGPESAERFEIEIDETNEVLSYELTNIHEQG